MPEPADGSGPGDHPGVIIIHLTGDIANDTAAIESALESKHEFLFFDDGHGNAIFATKY